MCPDRKKPEIADKLALLHERYFEELPGKVAEIEAAWSKLDLHSPDPFSILDELYRHVHSLTGSAGTFGADELSNTAKELQQYLKKVIDSRNTISQNEYDLIERLITRVKRHSLIRQ